MDVKVEVRGVFCKSDTYMSDEEFIKNIHKLCVPLLLPTAKSTLQIMTGITDLPSFSLPTIDIIQTIGMNDKESSDVIN